jgi:hypothetical protein
LKNIYTNNALLFLKKLKIKKRNKKGTRPGIVGPSKLGPAPNPKSNGPLAGLYFFKKFNRASSAPIISKTKDALPKSVDDALLKKLKI